MRFQLIRRLGFLSLGALAALSCSDSSSPGTGKLTLLLKDAACGMDSAVVTISQINLQGPGGTLVLRDDDVTENLLTLTGGRVAELVKDAELPAGSYTQLRFVISGAYIAVHNGVGVPSTFYASSPTYPGLPFPSPSPLGNLQMPSYSQSGLKVILPGNAITIPDGGNVTFVVDFDVCQSFGQVAGNSGQWVMHPVIKATGWTLTGGIQVTLTPGQQIGSIPTDAVFTAAITPTSGGTTINVDLTEANQFQATVNFLAPGDYSVNVTKTSGADIPNATITQTTPSPTTVLPGETATAAFVLDIPGTGT